MFDFRSLLLPLPLPLLPLFCLHSTKSGVQRLKIGISVRRVSGWQCKKEEIIALLSKSQKQNELFFIARIIKPKSSGRKSFLTVHAFSHFVIHWFHTCSFYLVCCVRFLLLQSKSANKRHMSLTVSIKFLRATRYQTLFSNKQANKQTKSNQFNYIMRFK